SSGSSPLAAGRAAGRVRLRAVVEGRWAVRMVTVAEPPTAASLGRPPPAAECCARTATPASRNIASRDKLIAFETKLVFMFVNLEIKLRTDRLYVCDRRSG